MRRTHFDAPSGQRHPQQRLDFALAAGFKTIADLATGQTAALGVSQSEAIWAHLKDAGYLDAKGKVQDALRKALKDGTVKPKGIDLDVQMLRPRVMFPRMLEDKEFHASELSLASYASLLGRGDTSFRALPVPVSKIFRHSS